MNAARAWLKRHQGAVADILLAVAVLAAAGMVLAAWLLPRPAIAVSAAVLVGAVLLLRFTPEDESDDNQ